MFYTELIDRHSYKMLLVFDSDNPREPIATVRFQLPDDDLDMRIRIWKMGIDQIDQRIILEKHGSES